MYLLSIDKLALKVSRADNIIIKFIKKRLKPRCAKHKNIKKERFRNIQKFRKKKYSNNKI